jgi:hypothetical protein
MKRLMVLLVMLLVCAGAFALDWGLGYVQSSDLSGISVTCDPVPLLTLRGTVNLLNAGLNNPTYSVNSGSTKNTNVNAYIDSGSIGLKALFNVLRPSPNAKF